MLETNIANCLGGTERLCRPALLFALMLLLASCGTMKVICIDVDTALLSFSSKNIWICGTVHFSEIILNSFPEIPKLSTGGAQHGVVWPQ